SFRARPHRPASIHFPRPNHTASEPEPRTRPFPPPRPTRCNSDEGQRGPTFPQRIPISGRGVANPPPPGGNPDDDERHSQHAEPDLLSRDIELLEKRRQH